MFSDRKLFTVSQFVIRETSRVDKLYFLKILSAFLGVNPHFTQWFFKSGDVNGALLWASELGQLRLVNLLINGARTSNVKTGKTCTATKISAGWVHGDWGGHRVPQASESFI